MSRSGSTWTAFLSLVLALPCAHPARALDAGGMEYVKIVGNDGSPRRFSRLVMGTDQEGGGLPPPASPRQAPTSERRAAPLTRRTRPGMMKA